MKQLQQCLFTACCLFFISLAAIGQDHAPGDLIVQLKKGADTGPLISRLQLFEGEVTGLKS